MKINLTPLHTLKCLTSNTPGPPYLYYLLLKLQTIWKETKYVVNYKPFASYEGLPCLYCRSVTLTPPPQLSMHF